MSKELFELRAGTFVRQLQLGAGHAIMLGKRASEVYKIKEPTGEWKATANDASQLAMMMQNGTSAELARLMTLWYTDMDDARRRGGLRLVTLLDYLDEVVCQLANTVEDVNFEEMHLSEDYAEPYFSIIVEALRMFARSEVLTLSVYIEHSDAGTMEEAYWSAHIRLTEPDDTFIKVPFFHLSDYFETREGGADAITEAYGLEPQYDDDTEEMLDDASRASRLESEMLDITDSEKLEDLLKDLTWLDFIEDAEPNETDAASLLAFVDDRAERIVAHYSAPQTQGAVSVDGAGAVLEAAQAWQAYNDGQKDTLIEVYMEAHPR